MPKHPTTGVRLEGWQRAELEWIGSKNGDVDVSVLLRWAVVALIKHARRFQGRLLLPLDFDEDPVSALRQLELPLRHGEAPDAESNATVFVDIPLLGMVPAGSPSDNPEQEDSFVRVPAGKYPPGIFALRVHGDSMIGRDIYDGDTVVLHKREARDGDVVVALTDEGITLKTLEVRKGKCRLRSENPKYKNPTLTDQSAIQGVMLGKL